MVFFLVFVNRLKGFKGLSSVRRDARLVLSVGPPFFSFGARRAREHSSHELKGPWRMI